MRLYGFGSTVAGCYVFPAIDAEDDWTFSRDPVSVSVGGRDGSADFYESGQYNIKPLPIAKTFSVIPTITPFTGSGSVEEFLIDDTAFSCTGAAFLTEVIVGDTITFDSSDYTVTVVIDDDHILVTPASPSNYSSGSYTITPSTIRERHYSNLEYPLNTLRAATISAGESKLWALMRDGSYRWAWAKCVSHAPPENTQTRMTLPVSLEFHCREGLWYNETQHTSTITSAGANALANAGNYPAAVSCDLTAGDAAVTAFSLAATGQGWAFAGTLAATKHLIVSPGAYTATNNGTGCYSSLTITDKGDLWLHLPKNASTSITGAITGGGTGWTYTLSWYDTWIM